MASDISSPKKRWLILDSSVAVVMTGPPEAPMMTALLDPFQKDSRSRRGLWSLPWFYICNCRGPQEGQNRRLGKSPISSLKIIPFFTDKILLPKLHEDTVKLQPNIILLAYKKTMARISNQI